MSRYIEDTLGSDKLSMLCKIAQLKKAIKDMTDPNCDMAEENHILINAYMDMIKITDGAIEVSKYIKVDL